MDVCIPIMGLLTCYTAYVAMIKHLQATPELRISESIKSPCLLLVHTWSTELCHKNENEICRLKHFVTASAAEPSKQLNIEINQHIFCFLM